MKKIIGLSALLISVSLLIIAGILFSHFINENIGGFVIIFSFLGLIFTGIIIIFELYQES